MKKVSMVVPCYNKVEYIGEFFQSVYDQVWDNIELILVNDGSTDGTREIIGQWEERFIDRGYSVRIVDQENKGVSAAVKAGLECVTGDFFCCPDCDDILHPEYVSKMAGILIENEDVARVACDCDTRAFLVDNRNGYKKNYSTRLMKLKLDLITAFIFERIAWSICQNMARSSFINDLLIAYQVDLKVSQEPQYSVINGYIGDVVYLPETLYFCRVSPIELREWSKDYVSYRKFVHDIIDIYLKGVWLSPLCDYSYKELFYRSCFGCALTMLRVSPLYGRSEEICLLEGMRASAEELSIPLKQKIGTLTKKRWLVFGRAVSNYLIGYDNPFQGGHYTPNPKGRIIAYGAYGTVAGYLLPLVLDTPLKPHVLWDRAEGSSEVMGISVTRPDLASLTPDDTVLVFTVNRKFAAEICDLLTASATDNILYYYDILDYLADSYFPLQLD